MSQEWQTGYDAAVHEMYGDLGAALELLDELFRAGPETLASPECQCARCKRYRAARAAANAYLVEGKPPNGGNTEQYIAEGAKRFADDDEALAEGRP